MREYQRLETGEGGTECYTTSQPDCYSTRPLRGLHLVAFIASLFFCLAVVVSFLWLLPCDLATCTAVKENSPSIPWDKTYPGIEVYGGLHVVGSHLVLLERAPLWGFSSISPDAGRLQGLSLTSGDIAWFTRLPSNDSSVACPPHPPPLCFTLSKPNTLFAIDPTTGIIAWKFRDPPEDMDFPIIVPDANKDGHFDLALISRKKNGTVSILVVSGGDGNVLTTEATNCSSAANLTFDKGTAQLRYDCIMSPSVTVSSSVPVPGVMNSMIRVRAAAGRPRTPSSHGLTIQYRNTGTCPDCATNVSVSSSQDRTVVWRFNESGAFLMRPLPISFKPNLSGFLLKLWHWNLPSTEKGGLRLESITERIVLITFDSKMTSHVVNASQTEITRLCNTSLPWQCQPSIHSNTALITDANGDGSQDLISYYVTYRPDEFNGKPGSSSNFQWQLDSKIRVVRLEAELPKLYDLVTSH